MKRRIVVALLVVGVLATASSATLATAEPAPDREAVEESFRAVVEHENPDAAMMSIACEVSPSGFGGWGVSCFAKFFTSDDFVNADMVVITGVAPDRGETPADWVWILSDASPVADNDTITAAANPSARSAVDHTRTFEWWLFDNDVDLNFTTCASYAIQPEFIICYGIDTSLNVGVAASTDSGDHWTWLQHPLDA